MSVDRIIYREEPLPPSAEPLFPPDLKDGEKVMVYPPIPPEARDDYAAMEEWYRARAPSDDPSYSPKIVAMGMWFKARAREDDRYWMLGDAFVETPFTKWINDPGPGQPTPGYGNGLERIPNPMILRLDRPRKRLPDFWVPTIVSDRLLKLLLEVDGEAIVHKPVVVQNRDGSTFDDTHHIIDIVRCIKAVDYSTSVVKYYGGEDCDGKRYGPRAGGVSGAKFISGIDTRFHIFCQVDFGGNWRGGSSIIVSKQLETSIENVKSRIRNARFDDLGWDLY